MIKKITKFDLFKVFLASFFVQAVWNFRSLLSVGFSLSFYPILGKLCSTPEEKKEFFRRHLRFFNAHPYFASFALGISIRLEESREEDEKDNIEKIDRIKDILIGPLGALGDRLFWATIKPACLMLGMVLMFISPSTSYKLLSLFVTFLLYNIPHFYYRYKGIVEGYHHPLDIYKFVNRNRFEKLRKIFVILFVLSMITLVIFYSISLFNQNPELLVVFYCSLMIAYFLNRNFKNFYFVALLTFIVFVTTGVLFF